MADPKLQIVIDAKDKTGKIFDDVQKRTDKIAKGFKATAAAFTVISGITAVIGKKFLDAAAEFEQTEIAFTTMLGSAEKATNFLNDLSQFAAKTPFELKEVEQGAKGLLAFGIETEKILPTLKSLGDVSAGLSVPMERLILNYGQVAAQTKLTGRELRDFAIAGVPLLGELSKMLGVSESAIQDMVSAGDIGFPIVEQAFKNMTEEGGRFNNLMDAQSKTFSGAVSNLKDEINLYMRDAGGPLLEMGKKIVLGFTGMVVSARESGGAFEWLGEKIQSVLNFIEEKTGFITILKNSFDSVATVFREKLLPELQKLWESIKPLMPFIKALAEVFGVVLYGALIAVIKIIEGTLIIVVNALSKAIQGVTETVKFFYSVWDDVTTILSKVVIWIDKVIESIKKLNLLQGAKSLVGGFLGFGGERAEGGAVSNKKTYLVGERGPELFTPNISGNIIPNNKLGSSVIVNVSVAGNVMAERDLAESIGDILTKQLQLSTAVV